jgi:lincosamide nucleotidyltransferase
VSILPQTHLIQRVKDVCQSDDRLDAAMMYGSFTYGEADIFSDIEFVLFFHDDALAKLDRRAWLEQIAPVEAMFVNERGTTAVIVSAPNRDLIRGEFHFDPVSKLPPIAESWRGVITFPTLDSTLIADKSGRLTPYLEPIIGPSLPRTNRVTLQLVADGFINWSLFGFNVLRRGEQARALELLNLVHRHLLQMIRALEGVTDHWLTPSRFAEQDLSPEAYARFKDCTAHLDERSLWRAYHKAWGWGGELLAALRATFGITYSDDLCWRITDAVNRET